MCPETTQVRDILPHSDRTWIKKTHDMVLSRNAESGKLKHSIISMKWTITLGMLESNTIIPIMLIMIICIWHVNDLWLGVDLKRTPIRHMFKWDRTTCSKYGNHSRLNSVSKNTKPGSSLNIEYNYNRKNNYWDGRSCDYSLEEARYGDITKALDKQPSECQSYNFDTAKQELHNCSN